VDDLQELLRRFLRRVQGQLQAPTLKGQVPYLVDLLGTPEWTRR
jgi:hypothetical protein